MTAVLSVVRGERYVVGRGQRQGSRWSVILWLGLALAACLVYRPGTSRRGPRANRHPRVLRLLKRSGCRKRRPAVGRPERRSPEPIPTRDRGDAPYGNRLPSASSGRTGREMGRHDAQTRAGSWAAVRPLTRRNRPPGPRASRRCSWPASARAALGGGGGSRWSTWWPFTSRRRWPEARKSSPPTCSAAANPRAARAGSVRSTADGGAILRGCAHRPRFFWHVYKTRDAHDNTRLYPSRSA